MPIRVKQERIIEAVRRGLEGDRAVEFVCRSGYAMNTAAIARHLRSMGGRGRIQNLIELGKSNLEILQECFPAEEIQKLPLLIPTQGELFGDRISTPAPVPMMANNHLPLYETARLTLRVPADLYEALQIAAHAENKTQNQLIVDILTTTLSQLPPRPSAD